MPGWRASAILMGRGLSVGFSDRRISAVSDAMLENASGKYSELSRSLTSPSGVKTRVVGAGSFLSSATTRLARSARGPAGTHDPPAVFRLPLPVAGKLGAIDGDPHHPRLGGEPQVVGLDAGPGMPPASRGSATSS